MRDIALAWFSINRVYSRNCRIEFGKAIAFLLSDDASYMSGGVVPIDGGLLTPRMNE